MGLRPGTNRVESAQDLEEWLEPALRSLGKNIGSSMAKNGVLGGHGLGFLPMWLVAVFLVGRCLGERKGRLGWSPFSAPLTFITPLCRP